jgi:hypothetical protein
VVLFFQSTFEISSVIYPPQTIQLMIQKNSIKIIVYFFCFNHVVFLCCTQILSKKSFFFFSFPFLFRKSDFIKVKTFFWEGICSDCLDNILLFLFLKSVYVRVKMFFIFFWRKLDSDSLDNMLRF